MEIFIPRMTETKCIFISRFKLTFRKHLIWQSPNSNGQIESQQIWSACSFNICSLLIDVFSISSHLFGSLIIRHRKQAGQPFWALLIKRGYANSQDRYVDSTADANSHFYFLFSMLQLRASCLYDMQNEEEEEKVWCWIKTRWLARQEIETSWLVGMLY